MTKPILAALAALLLASAPAHAQDVTFKKSPRKAGDSRTESMDNTVDFEVTVSTNGQVVQNDKQHQEEHRSKTVTILEVVDGKPTKVKVQYLKLKQIQESQMRGREEATDELEGKSFILEKSGDAITVTDDKGGKVDDLTADEIKNRESAAFKPNPSRFEEILPDRPLKIGETIQVDKEKANEAFSNDNGEFKVETMTLTLKETKTVDGAELAVFSMVIKGAVDNGGAMVEMNMTGKLVIAIATSMPHLFEMEGPIGFKQNQGGVMIEASGRTKTVIKATYSNAKAREATKGF